MIKFKDGDLFDTPADVRINTVNCVGVMGAGVALAFKTKYPEMFRTYQNDCKAGRVKPGFLHIWRSPDGERIVNFPTKRHWRQPSRYDDIEAGLKALREYLAKLGHVRVVLPALGCGHGGLDWGKVAEAIRVHLADLDAEITVFPPTSSRVAGRKFNIDNDQLSLKGGSAMRKFPLHLNYLPLRFTSEVFRGGVVSFEGSRKELATKEGPLSLKLRELRQKHGATHVFHDIGGAIACIGLTPEAPLIGQGQKFDILKDFQLANALARSALHSFLTASGNYTVIGYRPVTLVLEKHNLSTARKDVFGIFPEYTFDVRPLAPHEGDITSGVLVGFGVRYIFLKSAAALHNEGVPLTGLYVVQIRDDGEITTPFDRRYLGLVEQVRDGMAILSDSDVDEFPLDSCYPEGTRTNVEVIGRALFGDGYDAFSRTLLEQTFGVLGAEQQVRRLNDLGTWLEEKSPINCGAGLSLRIDKRPHNCPRGTDAGYSDAFTTPSCVLRPGGSITVPWPIDKQIDLHGPYDAESFPDKHVKIAVICPEEFVGEAGQFLRKLKEGINSADDNAPFRKGFVRKYHLNTCDFTFHEVKRTAAATLENAYKFASLEALKEKPNLAVTVIREQHRELQDAANPYYSTKARLMAQGVPVQMLKIETIRRREIEYVLNNVSLAMYAKLGGIPWTLAPNPDLAHEIVVGIGSARLTDSRRGAGERVIGITTVFSGDGQYLLANNTHEVSAEQYLEALIHSLKETVAELRSRFGWKPKDRVRFIFHQSFKKYKDIEAEAVKTFAASLTDFDVRYAFVHVSDSHNWMLFDPTAQGVKFGRATKGKMVPQRGQCVPLGPNTALLTLSGPYQVKTPLQGCPHPILVSIHEDSTFKSLDYLARQVFNLSFMSWRGFNPSTLPVSISYSNMIVDLLGHLRRVKNWNPEILATTLKEKRWFL
jgi:O-acetyl-ADP-ribose deacetylase (regulator of RNase III)